MTQPHVCLLATCTRDCTTECREAISRAWTSLRGELPADTVLTPAQPVPPSESEQLRGGRRLTQPRHSADSITDDDLDALYREIDTLTAVCRSNKRAYVGAVQAAMDADQRAERAEAALNAIRALADETDAYGYSSGWVLTVANIRAALDTHTTPTETR